MTKMMERMRKRSAAHRRARAIERAIRTSPSAAVRRELIAIASRYEND
jgi:hypothetical protein